jgi:hypothetical protein
VYYIYENWQAGPHKTVIHTGSCGFCNDGKGRAGGYDPGHAAWHGSYETLEDARDAANAIGAPVRSEHACTKDNAVTRSVKDVPKRPVKNSLNAQSLGAVRRDLFKILDWVEGKASRELTPMKRVIRLRDEKKIPKNIANLMQTVLGFRNIAEYDDYVLPEEESVLIGSAWELIVKWATSKGWN